MIEEIKGFGWCDYHEDHIDEDTYEWKGCWGCHHFFRGPDFPYNFVYELAKEFQVTPQTIRRWIRTGILEGRLFTQGRRTVGLPRPRTYHIEKGQNLIQLKNKKTKSKSKVFKKYGKFRMIQIRKPDESD